MLKVRSILLLLSICAMMFWWHLGAVGLIDPDEPFYAQTAREMVQTGDWITPRIFGQPQFEKPIGFYWMAAASFKVFGETEWAARFPSAFFGTALVLLIYLWGATVWGERTGLLSGIVLATGLEFAVMSRLMLTDIALAFFITAALYAWWRALEARPRAAGGWTVAQFIFMGLAVLTKGPVAWLICIMTTTSFLLVTDRRTGARGGSFWTGIAAYLLIAVPWFGIMLAKFGWHYFEEFFVHENVMRIWQAEHPSNNHYYYYVMILIFGSMPWIPALVLAIRRACLPSDPDHRSVFVWCWLISNWAFLTITQSKLPSYIFYLFAPLALVTGRTLDDLIAGGFRSKCEHRMVWVLAGLQFGITLAAPMIKVARPFATPALLMSAFLAAAMICWRLKAIRPAIALHVAATAALVCGALSWAFQNVDAMSSTRPISRALLSERHNDEPILVDKFLARGIFFYTKLPVRVLATKPQPFWSAHPLPVVVGRDGLRDVVNQNGSAICAVRAGDWPMWSKSDLFEPLSDSNTFGRNLLVRANKAEKKQ